MDNCPDRHQIDRVVTEAEGNTHRIEINFADDSSWDNGENWDQVCYLFINFLLLFVTF